MKPGAVETPSNLPRQGLSAWPGLHSQTVGSAEAAPAKKASPIAVAMLARAILISLMPFEAFIVSPFLYSDRRRATADPSGHQVFLSQTEHRKRPDAAVCSEDQVIAPSEAELTAAAYLAMTPRVKSGSGDL